MSAPMMACGHAANARSGERPVCAVCFGIDPRAEQEVAVPDLSGRTARCAYGCGSERPSEVGLAFFEYLGPGSREALEVCGTCGFLLRAHDDSALRARPWPGDKLCAVFTPRGDVGHDRYYCGCRGWD